MPHPSTVRTSSTLSMAALPFPVTKISSTTPFIFDAPSGGGPGQELSSYSSQPSFWPKADGSRRASIPVTAAARRLDGDDVPRLHLPADLGPQLLVVQEVAADPARLASIDAPRAVTPAVGEQREAGRFEEPHGADDAVTAAVLAVPARAVEQFVALDPHGILHLEGFRGSIERIAHPHVDAGGSRTLIARPLAAADGLVVGPALAPDYGVVHRPLALCRQLGGP